MPCDVTCDQLAEYAAGDATAGQAERIASHLPGCIACAHRLAMLRKADAALSALRPETPSPAALLAARKAVLTETRGGGQPEIMTLDEVAAFLRVDANALDDLLSDLPAFELGGVVRVRRARLMEWIDRRERAFARDTARSDVARLLADGPFAEVL